MIALYIHWPFCLSKCPYCDFNSHVTDSVDHTRWKQALLRELRTYAHQTPDRPLKSIFFGGGTPSLMEPSVVQALIEEAKALWPSSPALEITLEANPGTVDRDRFQAFHEAGINRLSMGIQSLRDDQLKFLGRRHTGEEALESIDIAQTIFSQTSFDLIYARPGHTLAEWEAELKEALLYAGGHLSLYQLTIEPGTAFYTQHNRGAFHLPQEELAAELYTLTERLMKASGRPSYEVSNYAEPGQECQHNLMYWRYQDYVGIGPGAHGRLFVEDKKVATKGVRAPALWLKQVEAREHGACETLEISKEQQTQEALMMGLRLNEGVPLSEDLDEKKLKFLADEGFVTQAEGRLKTTPRGRLCLNSVLRELLT